MADKHVLMWYKYVNSFNDRFALSPDQIEKAWSIRRECEKLAKEHVQRHADAFKEVSEGLVKLRAETPPNHEKIDVLEARLQKLSEPIDRIFAKELVPRLDKLPTREQRALEAEKAKEASTTAPEQIRK